MATDPLPTNPTRTPSGVIVFVVGMASLALFAFIVLMWVRASGAKAADDVETKRAAGRVKVRTALETEWKEKLGTAQITDPAAGTARVSLEEAMKLTLGDLQGKKVAASTVKLEPVMPMPPVDPKATEPPPPALPSAPYGADTYRFDVPFPGVAQPVVAPPQPVPAPGQNGTSATTVPAASASEPPRVTVPSALREMPPTGSATTGQQLAPPSTPGTSPAQASSLPTTPATPVSVPPTAPTPAATGTTEPAPTQALPPMPAVPAPGAAPAQNILPPAPATPGTVEPPPTQPEKPMPAIPAPAPSAQPAAPAHATPGASLTPSAATNVATVIAPRPPLINWTEISASK